MPTESRAKSIFMTLCLAAFVGVGAACFGLFGSDRPEPANGSCDDLSGPAKTDCENQRER